MIDKFRIAAILNITAIVAFAGIGGMQGYDFAGIVFHSICTLIVIDLTVEVRTEEARDDLWDFFTKNP